MPEYVDDTWSQLGVDGATGTSAAKPILLPDFVWPGKFRYCTACPAGTYTDGAKPIRSRCSFCARGTTTSGVACGDGADCCDYCAPGWRWDGTKCAQCAAGTWSPGGIKGTVTTCNVCPPNDNGIAGFTLNAGAGSIEQCKQWPICPGATADSCADSPFIIRKGFHLEGEDGTGIPTTQHYQKKTGEGETGYYCVECPGGTTTNNCQTGGGSCVVDDDDLPTPNPVYKKLKESKKQLKTGHHGHQISGDDDDELAGVDPVIGYEKVKYTINQDKNFDGTDDDAGADDDGKHSSSSTKDSKN